MIDDINPGTPSDANKCSSTDVSSYVNLNFAERNINVLKHIDVAWVIGSCAKNDSIEDWKNFLKNIGVLEEDIYVIDLDRPI